MWSTISNYPKLLYLSPSKMYTHTNESRSTKTSDFATVSIPFSKFLLAYFLTVILVLLIPQGDIKPNK